MTLHMVRLKTKTKTEKYSAIEHSAPIHSETKSKAFYILSISISAFKVWLQAVQAGIKKWGGSKMSLVS